MPRALPAVAGPTAYGALEWAHDPRAVAQAVPSANPYIGGTRKVARTTGWPVTRTR